MILAPGQGCEGLLYTRKCTRTCGGSPEAGSGEPGAAHFIRCFSQAERVADAAEAFRHRRRQGVGNSLACKRDHSGGEVHPKDLKAGISEFSCPYPTAAAEVHDSPLGDAVLAQPLQEARCRASGKLTKASVVNVGKVTLVGVCVLHTYLALLPCLPFQNGQKGQSSPWGKSSPSSCGQPMLPSVTATDLTPCWRKKSFISCCTFGLVVTSVATQRLMIGSAPSCRITPAAIFVVVLSSGPYMASVPMAYCGCGRPAPRPRSSSTPLP